MDNVLKHALSVVIYNFHFLNWDESLTFRFMLSDPEIPVKEKAATDTERKVTFLNLVPGRLYNITLWTVSGGVTSRPLERQVSAHMMP